MIEAATDLGPLGVLSTRVVESNAFGVGQLVALTASGWAVADQGDNLKAADGSVVSAEPAEFRLVTFGTVVRWPAHGQGAAAQRLWLGAAGAYLTAAPVGSGIRVRQWVAKVLDVDHLLYYHYQPFLI